MAVPKTKISTSRRGQRRSHDALKANTHQECSNCGELMQPHHICTHCGFFNSKQAIKQNNKSVTAATA